MQIGMTNLEELSLSEMEDLLAGRRKVRWEPEDTASKYLVITGVMERRSYRQLGKPARGGVRGEPADGYRRAPQAGPSRPAGIPARGHGASRPEGRQSRSLSHQCRRHRDAMAERGMRGDDQRAAYAAGAGSDAAPVPVSPPGISLRQRIGVPQPSGGEDAGEVTGGVHQVPPLPNDRQRPV